MDDWVEEERIQIETNPAGLVTTILTETFDQAALMGLLRRLYQLGYSLIAVNCFHSKNEQSTKE